MDRVVASIGNLAITEAQVEAEYRLEMFLDGKLVSSPPDAATFQRLRDRLIAQKLLEEEIATQSEGPTDPPARTAERLGEVRQRFGSLEAFKSALRSLGVDEQKVEARIGAQEGQLRRIEERFRPLAWPERAEIEAYYRDVFVPEFARQNQAPVPSLNEIEGRIREILVERKIDDLLDKWLEEMKSSRRVKVHDF